MLLRHRYNDQIAQANSLVGCAAANQRPYLSAGDSAEWRYAYAADAGTPLLRDAGRSMVGGLAGVLGGVRLGGRPRPSRP